MLITKLRCLSRGFSISNEAMREMCKKATATAFTAVKKSVKNQVGWELVASLEDTEVYHDTKIRTAHVYRRQGKVDCAPMKVISYVMNPLNARSWNEPVIESRVLQNLGEHKIIYQKNQMPWPLSVRDLVFAEGLFETETGGHALVTTSVEHPDAPVTSAAVRSIMDWSAIIAEENENDKEKCFVTYVSSWQLREETSSLREANYLIQKRNPIILKLRKLLLD